MGLSSSSLALVDSVVVVVVVVVIVVLVLEAGRRNLLLEEPPSVLRGGSVVARTRSPWTVESEEVELSFLSLKVGGVYLLAPLILDEGLARVRVPSSPSSSWEFSTFRPCFCLGLNRPRPTKRDERVLFRDGILTLDLV